MKINPGSLSTLGTAFSAAYARGLGQAASQRALVATTVSSTTAQNEYGWLGKFPGMREWIGDRVINQLKAYDYSAARTALMEMKGDHGRPLGIRPSLLVVAPGNESAALKILNNELGAGGETNEWKGTAKLEVVPWLA